MTKTMNLVSTGLQLQQPISIRVGRQLLQDHADLYVGDNKNKVVFKKTDVVINSRCN